MKYGIVQGRLTKSEQLQSFPKDWKSEFLIASKLGIYIELIAERNHNKNNPIWDKSGLTEISKISSSHPVICNDFIIDNSIIDDFSQTIDLIKQISNLRFRKFVLPLFEKSELSMDNYKLFVSPLRTIANLCFSLGITVCLETILDGTDLITLLITLNHSNIGIVYDTGNRVAFGHNLPDDIRLLGDNIKHIHVKDKNEANENVLLGTGLVNFKDVAKAINDIGYDDTITFETVRGKDPIRTIRYNLDFIKFFLEETK